MVAMAEWSGVDGEKESSRGGWMVECISVVDDTLAAEEGTKDTYMYASS